MLSTILGIAAIVLALIASLFAIYATHYARRCYLFIETQNKRSVSLKRLTEIEAELTEVTDSVVAVQVSLKKLRGRMHARSLNGQKNEPQDAEAWKREQNRKLIG